MRFLHGIRRAFPTACAGLLKCSCLPILALLSDGSYDGADNYDLQPLPKGQEELCASQQGEKKGCFPPIAKGDGGVHHAANMDLQPPSRQGGQHERKKGCLLPMLKGDDNADNRDLQPNLQGGQGQATAQFNLQILQGSNDGFLNPIARVVHANFNLQTPSIDGQNQVDEEGCLSPLPRTTAMRSKILQIWYVYFQQDIHNDSNVQIHSFNWAFYCALNSWLMPSPRPRVKMKGSMMLYDTHAWKHDAWVLPSSPSHLSINANLADVDHIHRKQAASQGFHLPFTPLRGRDRCQGREMQDVEMKKQMKMMSKPKLETSIMLMQMQLNYLTKDMLDPG